MTFKPLFWISLLLSSTSMFSQNIFGYQTYTGTNTATGDITIFPGATLDLSNGTLLLMPPGRQIRIMEGGKLLVRASCQIRCLVTGQFWEGINIDPANLDLSTAVTMQGGLPELQRIQFQDATEGISCFNTEGAETFLRGFSLSNVNFTNCNRFIAYGTQNPIATTVYDINSSIDNCRFTALPGIDSNILFDQVSNVNITWSEFTQPTPPGASGGWFIHFGFTQDIRFERNTMTNDGIAFLSDFENINVTHNTISTPRRHAIIAISYPPGDGGNDARIMYNTISGPNGFGEPLIGVRNSNNTRIEFNTVKGAVNGIQCRNLTGFNTVADNAVSFCSDTGIRISGDHNGDGINSGLVMKCNILSENGIAIQLDDNVALPTHLTQWSGFTVETDPGNQFINNTTDINNDNPNFNWLYYVLDASDPSFNPPSIVTGDVVLQDLQTEGRYACDELLLVQTPGGGDAGARAGAASVEKATSSRLFPNPAREAVELQLAKHWQDKALVIDIVEVSGKVVKHLPQRAYEGLNIPVSTQELAAGYYFFRISVTGEAPEVIKLIVVD
ncbi:MAG: T9SS type A sorting domain-containing protein [Bacteroidota bacterium]